MKLDPPPGILRTRLSYNGVSSPEAQIDNPSGSAPSDAIETSRIPDQVGQMRLTLVKQEDVLKWGMDSTDVQECLRLRKDPKEEATTDQCVTTHTRASALMSTKKNRSFDIRNTNAKVDGASCRRTKPELRHQKILRQQVEEAAQLRAVRNLQPKMNHARSRNKL